MPLLSFIAKKIVQKAGGEVESRPLGIRSFFDGLYRCQNELFELSTLSGSCWSLVSFVVSSCREIPVGRNMSAVLHRIMVDRPCIWFFVIC